jgi:autotransporter-associated beta strand protein
MKANRFSTISLCVLVFTSTFLHAGQTWDGGGTNALWGSPNNWDPDGAPDYSLPLNFQGGTRTTSQNNRTAGATVADINFTNDGTTGKTAAFTLQGPNATTTNSMTLGGDITTTARASGSMTDTIHASLDVILNGARTITTNTSHNLRIDGQISETGGSWSITKEGVGQLVFGNASLTTNQNSFSGGININNGVVSLVGATSVGNAAGSGTINLGATSGSNNAELRLSGTGMNAANALVVRTGSAGTKTLANLSTNTVTFSGQITANDSLAVLVNTNQITINNVANSIATGKTVSFSNGNGNIVNSAIWGGDGSTSFTGSGNGNITVSGASTYAGGTTLGGMTGNGVVIVQANSVFTGPTLTSGAFGTGTLSLGATKMRARNSTGGITVGNAITFTDNPTFSTTTTEQSLIFTGNASLGATRTLTVETGSTVSAAAVEFSGEISGSTFGIIKAGAGNLVLSGTNTYIGITTINAGTLVVNGSTATSAFELNTGTLTGNGTVGAVTVGAGTGGILSNNRGVAGASLTTGNLIFNGAATVNLFSNGVSTSAMIVAGALSSDAAGVVTINVSAPSWTNGSTFSLISYTGGSIGGAGYDQFTLGAVSGLVARQSATLGNSGTAITLAIAGDTPYWTGTNGSNWNLDDINWKLVSAGTDTAFLATDAVTFNDLGTNRNIDINVANVSPSSIIFNNSAGIDYIIGSLAGYGVASGSLTKNNTGTVTLNTSNTYLGGTTVNGGTLILGHPFDTLANSGAVIVNGGILGIGDNSDTVGAVTLISGSITGDDGIVTGASYAVESGTISAILGGSGAMTKSTGGSVTLSGNNFFTGGVSINAGTLILANAGALNSASGSENAVTFGALSTGVLNLAGNSITVRSLNSNASPGSPIVQNASVGNATLTVGNALNSSSTFAGVIQDGTGGGTLGIIKAGTGTLTLSGTNTYTGDTVVNGGVLAVRGNSIVDSAKLVINGSGIVNLTGTEIVAALDFDGTPQPTGDYSVSSVPPGATITSASFSGTGILTVGTPPSDPFLAWSGGAAFDADSNNDGVKNGLAWLLGATDKDVDAVGLLPKVTQNGGGLVMKFTCLKIAARGTSTLSLQHSGDLGLTDQWVSVGVPDTATTVGTVVFTVPTTNVNPNLVDLEATIPVGEAIDGKLFGRLIGVTP